MPAKFVKKTRRKPPVRTVKGTTEVLCAALKCQSQVLGKLITRVEKVLEEMATKPGYVYTSSADMGNVKTPSELQKVDPFSQPEPAKPVHPALAFDLSDQPNVGDLQSPPVSRGA